MTRGPKIALGVAAGVVLLVLVGWLSLGWYAQQSLDPHFFDDAISDFEAEDRLSPPVPGGVVFIGSSSIRMWSSLAEDMLPLASLNRGFGGAHMSHVATNALRLTTPYAPRAIVVYAGDNDLDESTGKTAETVLDDFQSFIDQVRGALGNVPIYFVAIKPSLLRWDRWPEMSLANAGVQALAASDPTLRYLDIATPMLGSDGTPRPELFLFDGLHLSDEGYRVWTGAIRPVLLSDLDIGTE